jgi:E3 ubiquitin-protein ligase HERC1
VLNLDLAAVVWKPLVGAAITRADIEAIDATAFTTLDLIRRLEAQGVAESDFNDQLSGVHFVTLTADGREHELKEGGKNTAVTWENRTEYGDLLLNFRINEFNTQIAAIRKGMGTIVPVPLLPLFTWQELELMVCGRREISIPYLQANTVYRAPFHPAHKHVGWLWEALESFSHADRAKFLRFCWGQSRLPTNQENWTQKFDITPARHNNDQTLPVSHTW